MSHDAAKNEEAMLQKLGLPPHRTSKGKGDESIRRAALGQISCVSKAENVDDDEPLFGSCGLLTLSL